MKYLRLISTSLLLLWAAASFAKFFKNLDAADGLAQTSVMAIFQDKLGRMWFGTREGLSVYNGQKIVNYKPWAYHNMGKDGLRKFRVGNQINHIIGNEQGDVFILADGNLLKYDLYTDDFEYLHKEHTECIAMDNENKLWCICGDSLFSYKTTSRRLEFYMKTGIEGASRLLKTSHALWMGTDHGLYRIDCPARKVECVLRGPDVRGVFESSEGEVWVGTMESGLYRIQGNEVREVPYDPDSPFKTSSKDVRCFIEDKHHRIWMGTFNGLQMYNPGNGEFTLYTQSWLKGGLKHSSIFSLCLDNQGTLWAGSYYGGVNYFHLENEKFNYYPYNPDRSDCITYPLVGNMTEDNEGNLWICLDGGGLTRLDRQSDKFTTYQARKGGLPYNNLRAIYYDAPRNTLYIGTHKGGLCRYNLTTEEFYNYIEHPSEKDHPSSIIDCFCLWKNYLLVGARNGLFKIHLQNNTVERISTTNFTQLTVDNDDMAWGIVTNQSFRQLNLTTLEEKGIDIRLPKDIQLSRMADNGDRIYIGSIGGGMCVYHKDTHNTDHYTVEKDQLISNYCYNVCLTHSGNLLLVSDRGITLFNLQSETFRSLELGKGLNLSSIANGCGSYVCKDGRIFIGGTDGMVSFRETNLDVSNESPRFYFSSLLVNNREIHPNDGSDILTQALPFVHHIRLSHLQNNLIIGFSSSNYVDILSNSSYEYKLEGLDKEWISTDRMELYYTNLSPGRYVLKVREIGNSLQMRVPQEIALYIDIAHAWFNTWWARSLFTITLALFGLWLYRVIDVRRRLLQSLQQERMEKKYINELNQAKLRFFTNISHEFKTPLTLIITQLDVLLQNYSLTPGVYNTLLKINKYTRQMKNLISELLDFRKFDQSSVTLKLSCVDMNEWVKEAYLSFLDMAVQKDIQYRFEQTEFPVKCWIDHRQMEKVVTNLLSNAFKFTPDGGTISIALQCIDELQLQISVTDNGKGIEEEDIPYVFNRFYQAKNVSEQANPGTGIGLALAKNIVELHHGVIEVESDEKTGCRFVVTLNTGRKCFEHDSNIEYMTEEKEAGFLSDTLPDKKFVEQSAESIQKANKEKRTFRLLIVEDNEDLLEILQQLFAPYYEVESARNGREGLLKAQEEKFDLVLSDVMMPEMSGMEMCKEIKGDLHLCHLPVVLLTALDSVESSIDGLRCGADDYIAKPFNGKVLLTRCNTIVRNRLLMQERFVQEKDMDVSLFATNPLDKKFLDAVMDAVEANLDKEDFDIPTLCRMVGISRTLLQTKFKALTDMSPNEFIVNHKLKIATTMLAGQPDLSITDISEKLGFGSPRYFSKIFKAQMGCSPKEYRNSHAQ